MPDTDWRSVIQTVAPTVATMLGGPLAGMAATLIGRVILGKPADATTSIDEAQAALASAVSTPEGLAKLKEAQNQAEQIKANLQVDLERIGADDRASARQREVSTKDKTPMILAGVIVLAWVGVNIALFTYALPEGNRELAARMMGTLDAVLMMVMTYYFGSSSGSRAKDGQIAAMSDQLAAASPLPSAASSPQAVAVVTPPAPSPSGTTADDLNDRSLAAARAGAGPLEAGR